MDDKVRKCCPNCCQLYQLNHKSSGLTGNLPLFLSCGHSICENCLRSLTKFQEPIECKVCRHSMHVNSGDILALAHDKSKLFEMFPVNQQLLGELTLRLMQQKQKDDTQNQIEECYIDLQAILSETENTKDNCVECVQPTTKMCQQCHTALCDRCFNKTHKNFVTFRNHALEKIAAHTSEYNNNCKIHKEKSMIYCEECKKSVCVECMLVGGDKSCKDHHLIPTSEINDSHMEHIMGILPKVNETFRRLSKTAVDIGNLLANMENKTGPKSEVTQMIAEIEQHFSKLCAVVQKHKQETIEIVTKIKSAEKESLLKAKQDIYNLMNKSQKIMNIINSTADSTTYEKMNLSALLDDATKMAEAPWYLIKEGDKTNSLKMTVKENLTELVCDFIHFEGNATSLYKLRSRDELGADVEIPPPPHTLVFPPQLPQDVRQLKKTKESTSKPKEVKEKPKEDISRPTFLKQAPQYRSKSSSVNSLNSCGSGDVSKRSYTPCDGYHSVSQVKSCVESDERKQLYEGDKELVYISHIVDPYNFYVQRASDQKLVKQILSEFRNAVSQPKPSLSSVTTGKKYLALNTADNMWLRCVVIDIDNKDTSHPKFVVFCFDFGSIETVSINNLRLLSPTRWNTPPPLTMNCSLANCKPVKGHWTSDDAILIQNIINNKQAMIHVRRVVPVSEGCVKLECDVTTYEQKVSLAHALVFHGRAIMPNPTMRYASINSIGEKPNISMSNTADFKPSAIEEINITHIVSPDKFFVRKRLHENDYLKLCEELNEEYTLSVDTGKIYLPELGMACVVNTEKCRESAAEWKCSMREECVWARGVVAQVGVRGRGRVRVHLVDSGVRLSVHCTSLRVIQHRFTTMRALATECHLAGITPLSKKWSPASVNLLRKYLNHVLVMQVEDNRNSNSIGVKLFDKPDEESFKCINHEMVKYKFAITIGIIDFSETHDLKDRIVERKDRKAYARKLPSEPNKPEPNPDRITILKKDAPVKTKDDDLAAKDKGPLRLEVKVLQCTSPSNLYVSLVHQQKTYYEMFDKIQEYYSTNTVEGKTEWNVGDKCCTLCTETQTWRRATILQLDNDKAKVFYSDFGSMETVPISNLKVLVPEFQCMGVAAIKCHLCGVMPAIGEEWPSLSKEFLKHLLDSYPRIFITKLGNFKDTSMPVEIWVYHTIPGGALEPNKSEWRCLNKKLIEQGLGIPIKSEQSNNVEGHKQDDEEILSFLTVTGPVLDWLDLESMPRKPLPKGEAATDDEHSLQLEHVDFNTPGDIFVSEWLPPEPLQCNEFTAVATYIDERGVIYLHDIAQKGTLDLIRNALNVRYKDPDRKAKYVKWTVGEPCIALYDYDDSFYRGRVLEVDEATSVCLVHYIDYGNEESCSFTNMRKSIALHQIPTQAHKCKLDRIQPIGQQWEIQTLDYIHRLLVDKHLYVQITGEAIEDITPIDIKYDKLWINDHLVEFELAMYISGAAVRGRENAAQICKAPDSALDTVIAVDSDSGPDYIVDHESCTKSEQDSDSLVSDLVKGIDWNDIIAEDENDAAGNFHTFPKNPDEVFTCNITLINDLNILPLNIVHDKETTKVYEQMFEEIQADGESMPPLNGIFRNKACIAVSEEDKRWYRAAILEYSEVKNRIKVRYVDYGDIEVIPLADTREINEEWLFLPPLTVLAKLHGIQVNPSLNINHVLKEYSEMYADQEFTAKVVNNDEFIPTVELRDSSGKLVYEPLIERGVFLKNEPDV